MSAEGKYPIVTPPGHGNSVLGLTKHQIPLAFRRYGGETLPPGVRVGRTLLADSYPTLSDWLWLEMSSPVDGHSLLPVFFDPAQSIPEPPSHSKRVLTFMELPPQ